MILSEGGFRLLSWTGDNLKQTGVIDARQVMSGDREDPDRMVDEQGPS
jgi:hypothetical protein